MLELYRKLQDRLATIKRMFDRLAPCTGQYERGELVGRREEISLILRQIEILSENEVK